MPIGDRICPYCLQPIQKDSLVYYVRVREEKKWKPEKIFKAQADACRKDNHYKRFWEERQAENIDWENRLVVTKKAIDKVMKGTKASETNLGLKAGVPAGGADQNGAAGGLVLTDGRANRGNKKSAAKPSMGQLLWGNPPTAAQTGETKAEEARTVAAEGIQIVSEGGQYKIYQDSTLVADTMPACERCWNVLPKQLFANDMEVIYISLVAGIGAGKSCLLLSWLRSINENFAAGRNQIRIGLNSMPERYYFRSLMQQDLDYPKKYEDMIDRFEQEDLCPKKTERTFVPPVFLEVEYKKGKKERKALLCIYDAAGEELTRTKAVEQNPVLLKHLERTDAVIFLADPDDIGLQTNRINRPYVHLTEKIQGGDTEALFTGEILESSVQTSRQSHPEASQKLSEILEEMMPDCKPAEKGIVKKKNTTAALLTLNEFMHNRETEDEDTPNLQENISRNMLMAFVLSKSDSFQKYYEEENPVVFQTYEGMKGEERENAEDAYMLAVRDFFDVIYDLETIERIYPKHREFLLSALGCEARPVPSRTKDGKKEYTRLEGTYHPFRIEDPIHWIVKEVLSATDR